MGRLLTCLTMLAFASSPALAKQGEAARTREVPQVVRISTAFGVVTSAWRSVAHNRAVGGVRNSYHLQGRAIDIARRPGVTHRQIDAAFRSAGYNIIESVDEGDHSHFAFGPAGGRSTAMPLGDRVAATTVPVKSPPPRPRLLADEHGTLIVDEVASPKRSAGSN